MHIISDFPSRREKNFEITNINLAENLSSSGVLHRYDSFDPASLKENYKKLGTPKCVITDYYVNVDENEFGPNVFAVPAWAAEEARKYLKDDCNKDLSTEYCAYIACNNKRINRYLGLRLSQWFGINFEYTWSGSGAAFDLSTIIEEMDASDWQSWMPFEAKGFLLAPITLTPKWIYAGNERPSAEQDGQRIVWDPNLDNFHSTGFNWRNATKIPHSRAAVILITEAVRYQRAAIITEKTIQSILGASFPLWIGGYGQADALEKIGFDSFRDIVNHDYQYKPTLIERCWSAFELNLKLLTDIDYANQLRHQARERLFKNQELLLNGLFDTYCTDTIRSWPEPAKTAADLLFVWKFGLTSIST